MAGANFVRRTRYLFFRAVDDGSVLACSVLCGREVPVDDELMALLRDIPAGNWVKVRDLERAGGAADTRTALGYLAANGLVVTDSPDESHVEMRRRDSQLMAPAWNRYAALFHAFTRWSDVKAVVAGTQPLPTTPDRWPPAGHFYSVLEPRDAVQKLQRLPLVEPERDLYGVLGRRRTVRGFEEATPVSLEDFSVVLRYVWGCHGTARIRDELTILKKTSPSGGCEHPGEVYPLVQSVEGVAPGIYHYSVEHHGLEVMRAMDRAGVRTLIRELTAGQEHFVGAHVVFLMTVRYPRNFWKYPAHAKAYRAVMLDAAHLSQTLLLVATELGLGAFVAGAVNEQNIDRALGLKAFCEGAVLITGLGVPAPSTREPTFQPYRPPA